MKEFDWIPTSYDTDPNRSFLLSVRRIVNGEGYQCENCRGRVRFYYHELDIQGVFQRRGSMWVWCIDCLRWDYFSGLCLNDKFKYERLISDKTISKYSNHYRYHLMDFLNDKWDKNEIPHTEDFRNSK